MPTREPRGLTRANHAQSTEMSLLAGDPVLAEIVRRLVKVYQPERIYLFGSVARGEAGPDSDYDLLVVVPDDAPPERKQSRLAYDVLWDTATAVDVVVCRHSYFEARRHLKASLPGTVLREGKLLHAEDPTLEEVDLALTLAREVYTAILARLPAEVLP